MEKRISSTSIKAFTLIELSIVLVIIGLIVGGILTGRELIKNAEIRNLISQIDKLTTATNTFRVKYGYLPGDIPTPLATQFGFNARGPGAGQGDGNGIVTGYSGAGNVQAGESLVFWVDLSTAKLIPLGFTLAVANQAGGVLSPLDSYIPKANLGSNYIYVYAGGAFGGGTYNLNGTNYFGVSVITAVNTEIFSDTGLTVSQAYAIDTKTDDGMPQTGRVLAQYMNYALDTNTVTWAAGPAKGTAGTAAIAGSSTTCFDNNNIAGARVYSISQNTDNLNCALAFKFY